MLGVAEDLRLRGVALGPAPFLLERRVELVGVLHAFDIAARARITVPVPGAADALARLQHQRPETHGAQPVQHVETGEAGADNDGIERRGRIRA